MPKLRAWSVSISAVYREKTKCFSSKKRSSQALIGVSYTISARCVIASCRGGSRTALRLGSHTLLPLRFTIGGVREPPYGWAATPCCPYVLRSGRFANRPTVGQPHLAAPTFYDHTMGGFRMMKNPRVRGPPSESVVGLESSDLFAKTGSRGDSLWRGVGWRPTKTKQPAYPIEKDAPP